ncbi:MAG: hypothetical protein RLZZ385_1375 [Pseudomonadota bacterium]|jgi:ElaA protein
MPTDPNASSLLWQGLPFAELDVYQLYELLQLRSEVFVVEQNCVYQDLDSLDPQAHHLLGYQAGVLVCYARILPPGLKYEDASIGRIISHGNLRGQGLGRLLVRKSLEYCQQLFPMAGIRISAQYRLERFYQELAFASVSEPYLEDGIPHIEMLYQGQAG